VIEYKLSELRAVELLDELCEKAGEDHALVKVDAPPSDSGGGAGAGGGDEKKARQLRAWVKVRGESQLQELGAT